VARFIARSGAGDPAKLEVEARRRLARMIADDKKAAMCDYVVMNDGTLDRLREQVAKIWAKLVAAS
jgi:dephospho-CoA kinase